MRDSQALGSSDIWLTLLTLRHPWSKLLGTAAPPSSSLVDPLLATSPLARGDGERPRGELGAHAAPVRDHHPRTPSRVRLGSLCLLLPLTV